MGVCVWITDLTYLTSTKSVMMNNIFINTFNARHKEQTRT